MSVTRKILATSLLRVASFRSCCVKLTLSGMLLFGFKAISFLQEFRKKLNIIHIIKIRRIGGGNLIS